jgi:hypothetical protein
MLQKNLREEQAAKEKLIQEINGIEDDKNKIGRFVLVLFAVVFTLASILLGVILLNPQER